MLLVSVLFAYLYLFSSISWLLLQFGHWAEEDVLLLFYMLLFCWDADGLGAMCWSFCPFVFTLYILRLCWKPVVLSLLKSGFTNFYFYDWSPDIYQLSPSLRHELMLPAAVWMNFEHVRFSTFLLLATPFRKMSPEVPLLIKILKVGEKYSTALTEEKKNIFIQIHCKLWKRWRICTSII